MLVFATDQENHGSLMFMQHNSSCYLLFVICYLLFVICYLLFVICYNVIWSLSFDMLIYEHVQFHEMVCEKYSTCPTTCKNNPVKSSNRPFSYSKKESGSNDISLQFVEFSNLHNCDRSSNATQLNLAYKIV